MISLASEMTDGKGRHARGWLFFDAECAFCAGIARLLAPLLKRRGLALAPLQDPRVAALLGLAPHELLQTIRFVNSDSLQYAGADAFIRVAEEFWWACPLVGAAKIPGIRQALRVAYRWAGRRSGCTSQYPVPE